MKIRLVDLDGLLPNIALMKISQFHKQHGDDVGWHNPIADGKVDKLYISKLFDFSEDYQYALADQVYIGGSGHDIAKCLPDEIDSIRNIDYSIYPNAEMTMQFYSRGCIRNCPFCIVQKKEGYIKAVEPMSLNPNGRGIEVLDNNFFANPEWKWAAQDLIRIGQPVNLQGVDVRIMDEEQAYWLNKMKHAKQIHIAWDNPKEDVLPRIREMIKHVKPYKIMCYVLIGYWSTPEQDLMRVEKLREVGVDPFVMPFNKSDKYQKKFARWVNHKAIFKSVKWEDYGKGGNT